MILFNLHGALTGSDSNMLLGVGLYNGMCLLVCVGLNIRFFLCFDKGMLEVSMEFPS